MVNCHLASASITIIIINKKKPLFLLMVFANGINLPHFLGFAKSLENSIQ